MVTDAEPQDPRAEAPFPSLGDRPGHHNTTALLGEAFLKQGNHIAMTVARSGFPQKRSYSLVFAHIDVERGSRLTELAQRTRVTPQAMSDVVQAMIRDGYIERRPDPDDGRAKRIALTDRGLRNIDEGKRVIRQLEARYDAVLGTEGLARLRDLLQQIIESDF